VQAPSPPLPPPPPDTPHPNVIIRLKGSVSSTKPSGLEIGTDEPP
jgi:hypothetical protein